jgi:hypothetical protein
MKRQEDARPRDGGCEVLRAINGAIVLASRCKSSIQLDTCKDTLLATDAANKLDNTVHATRHIHRIANIDILSVCHAAG